jgi:hypothetical protein
MIRAARTAAALGGLLVVAAAVRGHVNPPVVLLSDRDAMVAVLPDATAFEPTRLELTPQQKQALKKEWRFDVDDSAFRVHQGRDAEGRAAGCAVFLTQATIHSPVRLAVGLGENGRITGVAVVELSEESYAWVKPLIDQGLTKAYVGLDAFGAFEAPDGASGRLPSMQRYYAKVLGRMAQSAAALYRTARMPGPH